MTNKLIETVKQLSQAKVLLIGDFMVDRYVYADALKISPEAPVPVLKVINREDCCGGAASVAVDINALGGTAICIGTVGNDSVGKKLLEMLNKANADTDGIIAVEDRPTICKQRLIGLAQHRHRQQLIRIDEEDTQPLTKQQYQQLFNIYKSKLKDADIVCIQDYAKGLIEKDFCQKIIKEAKRQNLRVLADPPIGEDFNKFKGCSAITPNRKETSNIVKFSIEDIESAKLAAEKLKKQLKLEAAVITLDRDGAYLETDEQSLHIPTIAKNVYDVTGAGDMVLATLAVTLARGCDYKTAVEISNIAGGLEVEKFGVASVSLDEIIQEILQRNKQRQPKLQELEPLLVKLSYHRDNGQTIVFTNGCFDILHAGHIQYLDFCRKNGDIVVVGLNSDASVSRLKGPNRPINNQDDRAIVLSALESVDYICFFEEDTPLKLIEKIKPDVLIKGKDWQDKGIVGQEFVQANGGKVLFAEMVEGKSSTATIEKMNEDKNGR